jgi:hypothetical protein
MKPNLVRNLLGGLSLTSAMFMFQACYGSGPDYAIDVLIEGQVKSAKTGNPIQGIRVSSYDPNQFQICDHEGKFSFYTQPGNSNKTILFEDIDSTENGSYLSADTTVAINSDHIYLNIELEEQ